MVATVETGLIQATDVDELSMIVAPWELRMNQISSGKFRATLEFAQVKGIFLTREQWSNRVVATGATPPGYLHLSGISTQNQMTYAGVEIDAGRLMCGLDSQSTEFVTPDGAAHWVMLVPVDLITQVLGEEMAAELLPQGHTLSYDPRFIGGLSALVTNTITALGGNAWCHMEDAVLDTIRARLISAVCQLLLHAEPDADRSARRGRYHSSRRAILLADKLHHRVSVTQLAAALGVGRRTLEQGFRETFNFSPQFYLRHARLNGFHRALRDASHGQTTVTEKALEWGFTEFGRTAVEYRQLFGESPSTTLRNKRSEAVRSYSEAL